MSAAQMAKYQEIIVQQALLYAPKVVAALLTLVIGLWLASVVTNLARRAMDLRKVDATLTPFLTSLLSWLLKVVVFISVASTLGVTTTSFVAILGAAGLAVGLALQGSLSNFAGGVLILIFRPFKVGDSIEAQGESGTVREIQIFTTTLTSPHNRRIIIPNGALSNGTIRNMTAETHVRVDTVVGISYSANIDEAKRVLSEMVVRIPGVLQDPAPVVAVGELAASSVNIVVRVFAAPPNYWDVFFATVEGSKKALDAARIPIPFPQRDIHVFEHKNP